MTVPFGPDEGLTPSYVRPLDGCRWCGIPDREHFQRWWALVGWHTWTPLEQAEIKTRMVARRAARLNAEPTQYHAVTAWAPDHTGEEGIPFCADCKTESCPRWLRIQARLDRQRWGKPRRVRGRGTSGGWGGDEPW